MLLALTLVQISIAAAKKTNPFAIGPTEGLNRMVEDEILPEDLSQVKGVAFIYEKLHIPRLRRSCVLVPSCCHRVLESFINGGMNGLAETF